MAIPVSQDSGTAVEKAGLEPRFCGGPSSEQVLFSRDLAQTWERAHFPVCLRGLEMPELFRRAASRFLSAALKLEGRRGCLLPPPPPVMDLHDNEPFVQGSCLLPRLIT